MRTALTAIALVVPMAAVTYYGYQNQFSWLTGLWLGMAVLALTVWVLWRLN